MKTLKLLAILAVCGPIWTPAWGQQQNGSDQTIPFAMYAFASLPTTNCRNGAFAFTTDTHVLYQNSATGSCVWTAAAGASGTDRQTFYLAHYDGGVGVVDLSAFDGNVGATSNAATGPNSISYHFAGVQLNATSSLMVRKMASSTWSAAAGTVDVSFTASQISGGAPSAGSWNFNIYIGCAASSAVVTYGTAGATTAATPPANVSFKSYGATALNLPASCAASSPMEIWVQRAADTGGTTGVTAVVTDITVTIRGN